jgi:hypothetical protein
LVGTLRISTSPVSSNNDPSFGALPLAAEIFHTVSSAGA